MCGHVTTHTCSRHTLCSEELSGPTGVAGRKSVRDTPWAVMNAQLSTTPKTQEHLRRTSLKTKGISSCATKPALGWQPTHNLLPEVTHACHKSGSFHQGARGATLHKLGCYQYQGVWIQAAPFTQIYHSQQEEGHTQSVSHGVPQANTCHCPYKDKAGLRSKISSPVQLSARCKRVSE